MEIEAAMFATVEGSMTSEEGQTFFLRVKQFNDRDLMLGFPHTQISNIIENAAVQLAKNRDEDGHKLASAFINPSIGVMHSGSENKVPLVYDLMEALSPVVDRKVLEFALGHTFTPGDFTINSAGRCRLDPQMAPVFGNTLGRRNCMYTRANL